MNINCRTRDVTDGLSNTMMMGEAANGAYTATPKWTVCDGRFCTTADIIGSPGPADLASGTAWTIGSPLKSGNPVPIGWGVNITTSASDLLDSGDTHYKGIRGGWVMACTMEPINKNPVTGSFGYYGSGDFSSFTCQSSAGSTGFPSTASGASARSGRQFKTATP